MTSESIQLSWIKKRGVLLLLFMAFLLTSSLVFEQQKTIESQRVLIRDLFRDSMELSQLKIRQATVHHK
ncbi:MAG: hypothetical protein ACXVZV_07605 [Terriglobales bacterium]